MTRFLLSTCGVLVDVATIQQTDSLPALMVGAAGAVLAMGIWWKQLQPQVERWTGCDL